MKTILLLLLSVSVAFAVPGDAEWKKKLQESWKEVFLTYPTISKEECVKIVKKIDAIAYRNGEPAYYNPNKPVIYMRWQMESIERIRIKEQKARYAAEAAWIANAPNREREYQEYRERTRQSAARINAELNSYGKPAPRDPAQDLQNEIDDLKREQQRLKRDIRLGR